MTLRVDRVGPAPLDPGAEEVLVRMRDGTHLATDLYLPKDGHRHPTILVRLPYDKSGRYTFLPRIAPFFTERGYAFVVQDVAGKFRSEGETFPFVREVPDGYDTIEWITRQSWSNGALGMWGDSYYGFTQWAAVASGHRALRAIAPCVIAVEVPGLRRCRASQRRLPPPYAHWPEGIPPLYIADYFAHYWVDAGIYAFTVDWSHRPLVEVFDEAFRAIGRRSAAADEFFADGPRRLTTRHVYHGAHPLTLLRVPALHGGGWFDNLAPYQMQDFMALQSRPMGVPQYLHMDATDHEGYLLDDLPITDPKDHLLNDEALARFLPRYLRAALEFFDVHLAGRRARPIPRVRWNQGHVGWQEAERWPPPGAREVRFYLASPENAIASVEGGALAAEPEDRPCAAEWTHDPECPVPSTVADPFSFLREDPDERSVEERADVPTFTSEPFERPLDLTGPVCLVGSAASSGSCAPLFAKLLDVAPDGSARMVARGQILLNVEGGEESFRLELGHVGYRIRSGHRLRLHLAASDFPLYALCPGTADNPWTWTRGAPTRQWVRTGGVRPAHLRVWVSDAVKEDGLP